MKIKQKNKRRPTIIASSVVLVLVITGVSLYLLNRSHLNNQSSASKNGLYDPTVNNPTTDVPKSDSTEGQSTNLIPGAKGQSNTTPPKPDANIQPSTPFGNFVSNHTPSLSDKTQDSETSTCSTTAGVSCQITFSSGTTVLSLPTQTTDVNGNTSWNWSLSVMKFTIGTWKVSVTATNGTNVSTNTDTLVVSR